MHANGQHRLENTFTTCIHCIYMYIVYCIYMYIVHCILHYMHSLYIHVIIRTYAGVSNFDFDKGNQNGNSAFDECHMSIGIVALFNWITYNDFVANPQ